MSLREEREKAGLSQTELAKKSGISRVTINQLENGKRPTTTTTTLAALANAIGTEPSKIL